MFESSNNEITKKQPFHKETSHYFNEFVYNTIGVFRIDLLRECEEKRDINM